MPTSAALSPIRFEDMDRLSLLNGVSPIFLNQSGTCPNGHSSGNLRSLLWPGRTRSSCLTWWAAWLAHSAACA